MVAIVRKAIFGHDRDDTRRTAIKLEAELGPVLRVEPKHQTGRIILRHHTDTGPGGYLKIALKLLIEKWRGMPHVDVRGITKEIRGRRGSDRNTSFACK